MRTYSYYLLAAGVGLSLFSACWSLAEDAPSPSGNVEIIVQGRKYRSIREYRRGQIKSAFEGILSSRDLREFTENDLTAIIKEIYNEGVNGGAGEENVRPHALEIIQDEAQDFISPQQLKDFLEEEEDLTPVTDEEDEIQDIIGRGQNLSVEEPED